MKIKLRYIILALLFLPFFEVAFFGMVSSSIGTLPAFALLIGLCFLGIFLIKNQGIKLLKILKENSLLSYDNASATRGLLTTLAALLFAFPGFLTDILAACLLFAGYRQSTNVQNVQNVNVKHNAPKSDKIIELSKEEYASDEKPVKR